MKDFFPPTHFDFLGFRVYNCQPGYWVAVNICNEEWPVGEVVETWMGGLLNDPEQAKPIIKEDLRALLKEKREAIL